MGETYSARGKIISAFKNLVGKTEGRGPLGRHSSRWEDNIKVDL